MLVALREHDNVAFRYLATCALIPKPVHEIRRAKYTDGVLKLLSVVIGKPDEVQGHLSPS